MPPHHSVQGKKKAKKAEPKPKKKSMKAKKAPLPVSVEDSEEEDHSEVEKKAEAEDGDAFKIKYVLEIILVLLIAQINSWKEDGLSEKLLAAITDDPRIKQGLFPSPGANVSSSKGGRQKKTTWQWQSAVLVFSDHPKYSAAIARASNGKGASASKLQGVWSDRIRNRLKKMTAITRGYINDMGQTGAGIAEEDEINMEISNQFTNKWGESYLLCHIFFESHILIEQIKADCPWFFTM